MTVDDNSATATMSPETDLPPLDPSAPGFHPPALRGAHADEWRKLVIADMFRGKAFLPATSSDSAAATTPTAAEPDTPRDTLALYRASRSAPTPSYLPLALPPPPFSPTRTAISYLGVGPTLRGKFLPEEAKKRGVRPGANFARLVKGERVWVPVLPEIVIEHVEGAKDAKGEKRKMEEMRRKLEKEVVEGVGEGTWVEPSECMGPGQEGSVR